MSECQARLLPDHRRRPRLRPRPPPRPRSSFACWPSSRPPRPQHRLPRPCLSAVRLSRPLSCPGGGCPRRCGGCPRRRGWSRAPSVLQAVASLFIYRAFQLSHARAVWGRRTKRFGERNGETYEMREGEERRRTGRKWTAQMLHAIHLFSFPMVSSLMRKSPSSKLSCSPMLFYVGSPFYGYNYVVEQMNSRAEQLRL